MCGVAAAARVSGAGRSAWPGDARLRGRRQWTVTDADQGSEGQCLENTGP